MLRQISLLLAFSITPMMLPSAHAQNASFGDALLHQVLWRINPWYPDKMTTGNTGERDLYQLEGAVFYIPAVQAEGTVPLYGLTNGLDHMDSQLTNEGGYWADHFHGYPWWTYYAPAGTAQLIRQFNPVTGDHALKNPNETLAGYNDEPFALYGYPRYGNTALALTSLSNGSVTIESNAVTGGALYHWYWNGKQFINTYDYGRLMQSSISCVYGSGGGCSTIVPYANPTEGGTFGGGNDALAATYHGSPLYTLYNSGNTQVSRSIPLEWNFFSNNGNAERPIVWKDLLLGKDITLGAYGMNNVAEYVTVLNGATAGYLWIEEPTAYLTADFNRSFTYDPGNQSSPTEVYPCNSGCEYRFTPSSGFGGVIVATADLNYAMGVFGVYGDGVAAGCGSSASCVKYFQLINFTGGQTGGERDNQCFKWAAIYDGDTPAGEKRFKTWVMTGTVEQVKSYMNQLYSYLN